MLNNIKGISKVNEEYGIEKNLPYIMMAEGTFREKYPSIQPYTLWEDGFNLGEIRELPQHLVKEDFISLGVQGEYDPIKVVLKLNELFAEVYKQVVYNILIEENFNGYQVKIIYQDGQEYYPVSSSSLMQAKCFSDCYGAECYYLDNLSEKWLLIKFEKGHCGIEDLHYPVTAKTQDGIFISFGFFQDH